MTGVYLPRYYGKIQFINSFWRSSAMKYEIKFVNGMGHYTIYRYECGNYFIKLPSKSTPVKTSATYLSRLCPDELKMLRCKAGLRPYNVG